MSKSFCVLPWIHMATHPHGGTTLCCVSDHTDSMNRSRNFDEKTGHIEMLDLNKNTINELMNSDYFKQTRLQMLEGEIPEACQRCFHEEAKGMRSKRLEENSNYSDFDIERAKEETSADGQIDPSLEFVELRLGNVCNVKCRSCNPVSSSKWRKDYEALEETHSFVNQMTSGLVFSDFQWPEQDSFWDDLFDNTPNVKTFYINGGEPTLINEHYRFLEKLLQRGQRDVKLWYNINMTNIPDRALDLWKEFSNVEISCSIDDLGDRNHYIRYPTDWTTVLKNLDLLQAYSQFKTSITQTVSFYNYFYLDEFYEFMDSRGLYVHHNFVNDPEYLAPSALPESIRQEAHDKFNERSVWPQWRTDQLIELFSMPTNQVLTDRALAYTKTLDDIRKQSFEQIFPELHSRLL